MARNETTIHSLRELLGTGLVNARALQKQSLAALRAQSGALEDYPEFKARVEAHATETEAQIERIDRAIELNGSKPSPIKEAALSAFGSAVAAAQTSARDDVLKIAIAGQGAAGFEMASFASLERLARDVGDEEIAAHMERGYADAKAMQDWIASNIADLTARFAEREIERAA